MPVTNYYTVNGQIEGEQTSGGSGFRRYGRDGLGSVVTTFTPGSGTVENNYNNAPYGTQVTKTGTAGDPAFKWNGIWGYRQTGAASAAAYVRARHFDITSGRWTTVDPLWPRQRAYGYVLCSPVRIADPSGLSVECAAEAAAAFVAGFILCIGLSPCGACLAGAIALCAGSGVAFVGCLYEAAGLCFEWVCGEEGPACLAEGARAAAVAIAICEKGGCGFDNPPPPPTSGNPPPPPPNQNCFSTCATYPWNTPQHRQCMQRCGSGGSPPITP
jgi:RHS repeat-associated protein